MFEAGQFVDQRRLPFFASGQAPALTQLHRIEDTTVYDVGALMGQFIVETWGRDTLLALVRANGNILQVAGLNESEFLSRWMNFVRAGMNPRPT